MSKPCPPGKELNTITNRCIKIKSKGEKVCPPGKTLNLLTNRCIKPKKSSTTKLKIPEPDRTDSDFSPNQIDEMLSKLIEQGTQPIKQKFEGYGFFQDIYMMYLMKKYKSMCYTMSVVRYSDIEMKIKVYVDDDRPPNIDEKNNFVEKIYDCIVKKSIPFVIIPIVIIDPDDKNANHYNILIYRRNKHQIEHFEPHGQYYNTQYMKFDMIRDNIKSYVSELNLQLKKKAGMSPVKFISSDQVCPMLQGLQAKEEMGRVMLQARNRKFGKQVRHEYEPGGYCTIWSLFFIELVLKNPTVPSKDLLKMVIDKISALQLIDVARGYMSIVSTKLQQYYTILTGKPTTTTEILDIMMKNNDDSLHTALYSILLMERAFESNHQVVTRKVYATEAAKQLKYLESSEAGEIDANVRKYLINYFKNYDLIFTPSPTAVNSERNEKTMKTVTVKMCPPGKELNPITNRCKTVKINKCPPGKTECKEKTEKTVKVKTCPPGKELNPTTNRCKTVKNKTCPPGKELNSKTLRCNKIKDLNH